MNKDSFKKNVYGIFLIVSLIINVILFYYIYELENKNEVDYQDLNIELTNIYEDTYIFINEYKNINDNECTLIDLNEYSIYFTENIIDEFKNNLILENNTYYDCNNYFNSLKNNTIFEKNGMSNIEVKYTDDNIAYATNGESKYIIFKKIDNKWLIDMFN